MSEIVIFPQCQPTETSDDFLIRLVHASYKGKGLEKGLARWKLRSIVLDKLNEPLYEGNNYVNGIRQSLAKYNLPESIFKDLELNPYGEALSLSNCFSVIDSFAIFGRLKEQDFYAGAILDSFPGKSSKAVAFAQYASEEVVRKFASEMFGFKNVNGKQAYTEASLGREPINLIRYGESENIEAIVSKGEILFGGNGKPQNEVVRELIDLSSKCETFSPKSYALRAYNFEIDFSIDGGRKFRRGFDKIMARVHLVFDAKQVV